MNFYFYVNRCLNIFISKFKYFLHLSLSCLYIFFLYNLNALTTIPHFPRPVPVSKGLRATPIKKNFSGIVGILKCLVRVAVLHCVDMNPVLKHLVHHQTLCLGARQESNSRPSAQKANALTTTPQCRLVSFLYCFVTN